MPAPVNNAELAAQTVDLLKQWNDGLLTDAEYAEALSALYDGAFQGGVAVARSAALAAGANSNLNTFLQQARDLWGGPIDGGPDGDGQYPIEDGVGNSYLLPGYALLADSLGGNKLDLTGANVGDHAEDLRNALGLATESLTFAPGQTIRNSTPYGLNIALQESTDGTSNRAAAQIGNNWLLGQDSEGSGTRNFFLYNLTTGSAAISVDPADSEITLLGALSASAGISGDSYLNVAYNQPGLYLTDAFADIGFGGTWRAANAIAMDFDEEHLAAVAPFALISRSGGSLHNGPGNAAYAGFVLSYKADYLQSNPLLQKEGEVDGLSFYIRQGEKSDASGIMLDVRKVGDTDGSVLSIEARTSRLNYDGEETHAVHSMVGMLESTVNDGGDAGFRAEARVGPLNVGFALTHFQNATDMAQPGGAPSVKWAAMFSGTRSSDDRFFSVTGTESGAGTPGAVQIGAGSVAINRVLSQVFSLDFPAIAANNTEALSITVTGARRGDLVSVSPADESGANDYADDKLIFTGRVTADDTVVVQAHNMGASTVADPAGQSVRVLVTGYETTIDD